MNKAWIYLCLCICSLNFLGLKAQDGSSLISERFYAASLADVLGELQRKHGYYFAFDPQLLDNTSINTEFRSLSITQVLDRLLANTDLEYHRGDEKHFVIIPRVRDEETTRGQLAPRPPQPFVLKGMVQDLENESPLAFARIQVKGAPIGAYCDEEGYFSLNLPGRDSLEIEVSYFGYAAKRYKVCPFPARTSTITFGLESAPQALPPVYISEGAEKSFKVLRTAGEIQINPQRISRYSGLGEPDLFRALSLLPGVGTQEARAGLYIRGGTPEQNLVRFDGITAYGVEHFFGLFSSFNPHAIQSVKLFRGGFGAQYGGRVSGVVDIIGKQGKIDKPSLSFNQNLLSSSVTAEIPLWNNKGTLLLAGRRSLGDWIGSPLFQKLFTHVLRSNSLEPESYGPYQNYLDILPEFYFQDINAKLTLYPTKEDIVSISMLQSRDYLSYKVRGREGLPKFERFEELDVLTLKNRGASLTWGRQWQPHWYSKVQMSLSSYNSDYFANIDVINNNMEVFQNRFVQDNLIRDASIRAESNIILGTKGNITLGTEWTRQFISYNMGNSDSLWLDATRSATTTSAFVQHTYQPSSRWEIGLGARYSNFSARPESLLEPRLSVSFMASDQLTLKGSWGLHSQFVNPITFNNGLGFGEDFWALADNENLSVMRSAHWIAGMVYERPNFLIEVEAYHKKITGLLTYDFAPDAIDLRSQIISYGSLRTGGVGNATGLDVLIEKQIGPYTSWLSYSLSHTRHQFDQLNNGESFAASNDQRNELKWTHTFEQGCWSFSATWVYASGRPYTELRNPVAIQQEDGSYNYYVTIGDRNAQRLPDYHRLDVSAAYGFQTKVMKGKVGFSVFNAYNQLNIRSRRFSLIKHSMDYSAEELELVQSDIYHLGLSPNVFLELQF